LDQGRSVFLNRFGKTRADFPLLPCAKNGSLTNALAQARIEHFSEKNPIQRIYGHDLTMTQTSSYKEMRQMDYHVVLTWLDNEIKAVLKQAEKSKKKRPASAAPGWRAPSLRQPSHWARGAVVIALWPKHTCSSDHSLACVGLAGRCATFSHTPISFCCTGVLV